MYITNSYSLCVTFLQYTSEKTDSVIRLTNMHKFPYMYYLNRSLFVIASHCCAGSTSSLFSKMSETEVHIDLS